MVSQLHFPSALLLSKKLLAPTECEGSTVRLETGEMKNLRSLLGTQRDHSAVASLIIFLDPLSSYGSYSENQWQAVALLLAAHSLRLFAFAIHTSNRCARSVNYVRSQTHIRDILLNHHRCHWIFCGRMDACYTRRIGKIWNKIADCRNSTVSDGFYNFNQSTQTTVICH
jgi:hypothetical protein